MASLNAAQIRAFPYNKLLEEERQTQVAFNTEARAKFSEQPTAHGSKPKHVYLIDEAENTYAEDNTWDDLLKCHPEDVNRISMFCSLFTDVLRAVISGDIIIGNRIISP